MRKKASESSEAREPGDLKAREDHKKGDGVDLLRLLTCGKRQVVMAKMWVV